MAFAEFTCRFNYRGYPCVVLYHPELMTIPAYYTGYVGLSEESPWYGKDYYHEIPVICHGDLTYGRFYDENDKWSTDEFLGATPEDRKLFWIGFDCNHLFDTIEKCNLEFVQDELKFIVDQLILMIDTTL